MGYKIHLFQLFTSYRKGRCTLNFKADRLKPDATSLAIRSSYEKESKALDRSASRVPKQFGID